VNALALSALAGVLLTCAGQGYAKN